MRGLRFSLFSKIMLWVFLNLLVLGAILWLIFNLNFRFEPNAPFFGGTTNRIEAVTRLLEREMDEKSRAERDEVLRRYTESYGVEFFLYDNTGRQLGGRETTLPAEILAEVARPEPPPPPGRQDNPALSRERPGGRGGPPPRPGDMYLKTKNPTLYWMVARTMTREKDNPAPVRTRLLAVSDSFTGHGLFFDPTPWLIMAGVIFIVSIIFWLPFVRSLTKTIGQMTNATEQIAEEHFDVRVDERRTDELGRLGKAINYLATRLSGFITGQKRFLGDISHELNSPLARMQFALTILEDRVDGQHRSYVEDVKEEVELMSKLVSELLAYSKAGIKGLEIELEPVRLRPLFEQVIARETAKEDADIELHMDDKLEALAQPDLLARALANVIRNAVRYAGTAGTIRAAADESSNGHVKITVADSGAGVPDSDLEKLFDPFYRIESDRSRQSGGAGLGLAIVKSCIEACDGKVLARNRQPHGFEVTILLRKNENFKSQI
jgi:two-component system sensor histidine kinase CpxA